MTIILIIFFSEYMFCLIIFCGRRVDCLNFRIPFVFLILLHRLIFLCVFVYLSVSLLNLLCITILQLTIPTSLEPSIPSVIFLLSPSSCFSMRQDITQAFLHSSELGLGQCPPAGPMPHSIHGSTFFSPPSWARKLEGNSHSKHWDRSFPTFLERERLPSLIQLLHFWVSQLQIQFSCLEA